MIRRPTIIALLATLALATACSKEQRIHTAIQRGLDHLCAIQRPDGAIADTANPLFEVWETVAAATTLRLVGDTDRKPTLDRAVAFLQTCENAEGLVCQKRNCAGIHCVETSSRYIQLLSLEVGVSGTEDRRQALARYQRSGGHWALNVPEVNNDSLFPSVTAFAMQITRDPGALALATNWLIAQQHPDGSWGSTWEYYGSPAYALWPAIPELTQAGGPEASAARDRAIRFLTTNQQPDGSWAFPPVNGVGTQAIPQHLPSPALHTALSCAALSTASEPHARNALSRGIDWLLAHQRPDGSWDGGYFPIPYPRYTKREDVFATALALEVLARKTYELAP